MDKVYVVLYETKEGTKVSKVFKDKSKAYDYTSAKCRNASMYDEYYFMSEEEVYE